MRKARKFFAENLRPLTAEEYSAALQPIRPPSLTTERIRASHHIVALYAAMGLRPTEIAEKCGYTSHRVNTLLRAPAFQQLVAEKRAEIEDRLIEETIDIVALDRSAWAMAIRQRYDALAAADESGEAIPLRTLSSMIADGSDRYGVPKKSTNVNLNADFAAELERALARSDSPNVITVEPAPEGGIRRRI